MRGAENTCANQTKRAQSYPVFWTRMVDDLLETCRTERGEAKGNSNNSAAMIRSTSKTVPKQVPRRLVQTQIYFIRVSSRVILILAR